MPSKQLSLLLLFSAVQRFSPSQRLPCECATSVSIELSADLQNVRVVCGGIDAGGGRTTTTDIGPIGGTGIGGSRAIGCSSPWG